MHAQVLSAPRAVGILGGMGPAAGADFVRLFVQACSRYLRDHGHAVSDQSFPEHWLVQMPIPDRTLALLSDPQGPAGPAPHMQQGLGRLVALGVRSVAVACNTAHVWHGQLQAMFPQVQLLHIAQETAAHLQSQGVQKAIVLATAGTYQTGLYDTALKACGVEPLRPDAAGIAQLMRGIYEGVKGDDLPLAEACFAAALEPLQGQHGHVPIIMGCTEIPLALPQVKQAQNAWLVDPAWILAQALAQQAYAAP